MDEDPGRRSVDAQLFGWKHRTRPRRDLSRDGPLVQSLDEAPQTPSQAVVKLSDRTRSGDTPERGAHRTPE
jgi:hypothetical protein